MVRTRMHDQGGVALLWWLIGVVALIGLLLALWVWIMMAWSYSSGERAGWVQKLSRKGYFCKTWEGEMAMVSLPGSVPEKFFFTVWDDKTAQKINDLMGRRVSLYYEEHILLPSSCFGDTRHFVKSVKLIEGPASPMSIPGDGLPSLPLQKDDSPAPSTTAPTAPSAPSGSR
ncbi:MAG TPA: hypothetical protein VFA81_02505 [Burkholderiales bacterium]|nr:hypothetical protein [Burkholderiales bacterium]